MDKYIDMLVFPSFETEAMSILNGRSMLWWSRKDPKMWTSPKGIAREALLILERTLVTVLRLGQASRKTSKTEITFL